MAQGGDEHVERLIRELLGTGEMNADSVADLERMRAENEAGTLDEDDRAYLEAFHQRIMASRAGAPIGEADLESSETGTAPVDHQDAGAGGDTAAARIAELEAELAAALARAEAAEAELERLRSLTDKATE
ncbi:hypothetical protein GCM10007989_09370 [Devosia pacifica]|uniref:Uncharacterized protein n=1 Tax=Devosia pacifica TaxID=1335967 RepID=A0A918VP35_9HYPH|nr:hypothetical protein [Devosia pacifica]GHA16460.1 hypothetical protein GCM10007989_09370 [Devosia pacifica]